MSDEALIRLENLKRLGLSPTDLKERAGNSYQYWRDLMAGKKSFGEKAARNIEAKLDLSRGTLDLQSKRADGALTTIKNTEPGKARISKKAIKGRDAVEDELPRFSRSPVGGKRSSDIKARVADETKFALQRRCAELGITESDYIDRLVCVSLFGLDEVVNMERLKTEKVAGMWHKVGPSA